MPVAPVVLVTGATGFIGSALVRQLLARGYGVRALIRPGSQQRLPEQVRCVEGDLGNAEAIRRAMDGVEAVFHLLAKLHIESPARSLRKEYRRVNVDGTRALLDGVAGSQIRRFIFFSSINVYGRSAPGQILDEESPLDPDSYYAESKIEAEQLARETRSSVILRLAAVYGPGMKGNYPRLVSGLKRGWVPMLGIGANRRTLIYLSDACRAAIHAVESPGAGGQTLNVTDDSVHTLSQIITAICEALGRPAPRLQIPTGALMLLGELNDQVSRLTGLPVKFGRVSLEKLLGDLAVKGDKIQKCLGFRPEYGLREGWERTVKGTSEDSSFGSKK